MINDLEESKKKDLLFYTKLTIMVKYLPDIMNKIKIENKEKNDIDIIASLIKETKVKLSRREIAKLEVILDNSLKGRKGMQYKTYKKMLELKLKRKKEQQKPFQDNDRIELFLISSLQLLQGFNKLKEDQIINRKIKEDTAITMKNYINGMLTLEDIKVLRRKHEKR